MDGLVSRASMIRLSLHPLPASETSAFNKIRAFSTRRAGLFPFRISVSSRSRSSPLSRTTYFFTEISFAAMIASLASRWRRKRITTRARLHDLCEGGMEFTLVGGVHHQDLPSDGTSRFLQVSRLALDISTVWVAQHGDD